MAGQGEADYGKWEETSQEDRLKQISSGLQGGRRRGGVLEGIWNVLSWPGRKISEAIENYEKPPSLGEYAAETRERWQDQREPVPGGASTTGSFSTADEYQSSPYVEQPEGDWQDPLEEYGMAVMQAAEGGEGGYRWGEDPDGDQMLAMRLGWAGDGSPYDFLGQIAGGEILYGDAVDPEIMSGLLQRALGL